MATQIGFRRERGVQPAPKLGVGAEVPTGILAKEAKLPRRERRPAECLFQECAAAILRGPCQKEAGLPRAPTGHFTRKRFKISQVIPGRFPTCPSARSGFSLAAPRARGAIASRQIVQA